VLPINEQLPKEVKNYFDPQSVDYLLRQIEKISEFQETQEKLYTSRTYQFGEKYSQQKTEFMKMRHEETRLDKIVKQEKSIMKRLKDAYK
jgi:hypothetical protein